MILEKLKKAGVYFTPYAVITIPAVLLWLASLPSNLEMEFLIFWPLIIVGVPVVYLIFYSLTWSLYRRMGVLPTETVAVDSNLSEQDHSTTTITTSRLRFTVILIAWVLSSLLVAVLHYQILEASHSIGGIQYGTYKNYVTIGIFIIPLSASFLALLLGFVGRNSRSGERLFRSMLTLVLIFTIALPLGANIILGSAAKKENSLGSRVDKFSSLQLANCDQFITGTRDVCYSELALQKHDVKVCANISMVDLESLECYKPFALSDANYAICGDASARKKVDAVNTKRHFSEYDPNPGPFADSCPSRLAAEPLKVFCIGLGDKTEQACVEQEIKLACRDNAVASCAESVRKSYSYELGQKKDGLEIGLKPWQKTKVYNYGSATVTVPEDYKPTDDMTWELASCAHCYTDTVRKDLLPLVNPLSFFHFRYGGYGSTTGISLIGYRVDLKPKIEEYFKESVVYMLTPEHENGKRTFLINDRPVTMIYYVKDTRSSEPFQENVLATYFTKPDNSMKYIIYGSKHALELFRY